MALFTVLLFGLLGVAKAAQIPRDTDLNTITPGPSPSCVARCDIDPPDLDSWVWRPVTITSNITLATVVYIVNNRTNTTRTTTITNTLPAGITPPPTNAAGTALETLTYEAYNGKNSTTVVTYPTVFFEYGSEYAWRGTLNATTTIKSGGRLETVTTCLTAPSGGSTITLRSHPPLTTSNFYAWSEDAQPWSTCMSSQYGSSSSWPPRPDAAACQTLWPTEGHEYPEGGDEFGLTYSLVAGGLQHGFGIRTDMFPEMSTYLYCSQSLVAPVQAINTVGFLTETSVSFEEANEPTPPPEADNPPEGDKPSEGDKPPPEDENPVPDPSPTPPTAEPIHSGDSDSNKPPPESQDPPAISEPSQAPSSIAGGINSSPLENAEPTSLPPQPDSPSPAGPSGPGGSVKPPPEDDNRGDAGESQESGVQGSSAGTPENIAPTADNAVPASPTLDSPSVEPSENLADLILSGIGGPDPTEAPSAEPTPDTGSGQSSGADGGPEETPRHSSGKGDTDSGPGAPSESSNPSVGSDRGSTATDEERETTAANPSATGPREPESTEDPESTRHPESTRESEPPRESASTVPTVNPSSSESERSSVAITAPAPSVSMSPPPAPLVQTEGGASSGMVAGYGAWSISLLSFFLGVWFDCTRW